MSVNAALTAPGGPELIVILLIVVLLFGARKLPELGSSIGKSIKNFKKGVGDAAEDDDSAPPAVEGAEAPTHGAEAPTHGVRDEQ